MPHSLNDLVALSKEQLINFFTVELPERLRIHSYEDLKNNPNAIAQLEALGFGPQATTENSKSTLLFLAARAGLEEVINVLTHIGFDKNYLNKHHANLILYAALGGIESITLAQKMGFDIHSMDSEGRTLLFNLIEGGQVQDIEHLLKMGLNLHAQLNNGHNLLQYAVIRGQKEAIKYLVEECGFDPDIRSRQGNYSLGELAPNQEIRNLCGDGSLNQLYNNYHASFMPTFIPNNFLDEHIKHEEINTLIAQYAAPISASERKATDPLINPLKEQYHQILMPLIHFCDHNKENREAQALLFALRKRRNLNITEIEHHFDELLVKEAHKGSPYYYALYLCRVQIEVYTGNPPVNREVFNQLQHDKIKNALTKEQHAHQKLKENNEQALQQLEDTRQKQHTAEHEQYKITRELQSTQERLKIRTLKSQQTIQKHEEVAFLSYSFQMKCLGSLALLGVGALAVGIAAFWFAPVALAVVGTAIGAAITGLALYGLFKTTSAQQDTHMISILDLPDALLELPAQDVPFEP